MSALQRKGSSIVRSPLSREKPTARELEIIRLLIDGKANKEIAAALGITVRAVETHRADVMQKLGLHSVSELSSLRHPQ